MAIRRKGSDDFVGKSGRTVTYRNKWGDLIQRTIGVKEGSKGGEFGNQQGTALITYILKPLKSFIAVGFKNPPKDKHWDAYNYATSYNKINALQGTYPNREIDFNKFKVSKGDMPLPLNAKVELVNNLLQFTWDPDLQTDGNSEFDQVMLVAYMRESNKAICIMGGAMRTAKKDKIKLTKFTKPSVTETYIAFVSNNRERMSDSVYLGQIIREQ
jgi:hypothetical protein